jgi:hypothetical protein
VKGEEIATFDQAVKAVETVEKSAGIFGWLDLLIPPLVLLAIAGLASFSDRIPGHLKVLIAPLLGALADGVGALASGTHANPLVGGILGALAVFLHQVYKQWRIKSVGKTAAKSVTVKP